MFLQPCPLRVGPPLSPSPSPSPAQIISAATRCRFSARYGDRSGGGSMWDRDTRINQWPKMDDYNGENDVSGFSSAAKPRIWWSDDESSWDTDYYDGYEDDDDDDGGDHGVGPFGVLEDSNGLAWMFKLVQAFGWIVPAIIISMVLGTGSNAIIMALVLPIAQTTISLVIDTCWQGESKVSSTRPNKSRTKRRPSTRTTSNFDERDGGKTYTHIHSWGAGNRRVSGTKGEERSTQSYGGWDELDDNKHGTMDKVLPKGPRKQKKTKLSKSVRRKRDSPLLVRLLISVFPFVGL